MEKGKEGQSDRKRETEKTLRTANSLRQLALALIIQLAPLLQLTAQDSFQDLEYLFTTPKAYLIYHASNVPVIDGKPSEQSWKKAPWSDYFEDITGALKLLPWLKTRFKMLWDDHALYIYTELEEPDIWASLTERDQIVYYDNDFEVFIDPDGDAHNYFEIEVNAFGTVFDLFMSMPYRDGGHALISWDALGLQVAIQVDGRINDPRGKDKKWTVEMAIPFRAITMGNVVRIPLEGETWRMNFSRVQWDLETREGVYHKKCDPLTSTPLPEHNWVWSPQGLINMHYPERWGYAQFTKKEPGEAIQKVIIAEEEMYKNYLWLVYYKQSRHYQAHGQYATHLRDLGIDTGTSALASSLVMEGTTRQFYATIHSPEGLSWQINQDGRMVNISSNNRWGQ